MLGSYSKLRDDSTIMDREPKGSVYFLVHSTAKVIKGVIGNDVPLVKCPPGQFFLENTVREDTLS